MSWFQALWFTIPAVREAVMCLFKAEHPLKMLLYAFAVFFAFEAAHEEEEIQVQRGECLKEIVQVPRLEYQE